jgi:hypothetical protein
LLQNIPLLASRGWDQFSKSVSGDEDALVYLTPAGGIGTQGSFGEETGRHVHDAVRVSSVVAFFPLQNANPFH